MPTMCQWKCWPTSFLLWPVCCLRVSFSLTTYVPLEGVDQAWHRPVLIQIRLLFVDDPPSKPFAGDTWRGLASGRARWDKMARRPAPLFVLCLFKLPRPFPLSCPGSHAHVWSMQSRTRTHAHRTCSKSLAWGESTPIIFFLADNWKMYFWCGSHFDERMQENACSAFFQYHCNNCSCVYFKSSYWFFSQPDHFFIL